MIKFQNITKIYPTHLQAGYPTVALGNVSFEIKEGEFVSIVGRSGAGKTTLLKLILVEEKPTKGRIFFEGEELSKLKPEKLPQLRRKIVLTKKIANTKIKIVATAIPPSREKLCQPARNILFNVIIIYLISNIQYPISFYNINLPFSSSLII